MSNLLDTRPIAIEEGIDSCVLEESNNGATRCDSDYLNNITNRCSEDSISTSLNEKESKKYL